MSSVLTSPTARILTPGDPGWDDARQAWSLAVGQHPPGDHLGQRLPVSRIDEHVPRVDRGEDQPCTTRRTPRAGSGSSPSRPKSTCTSPPGAPSTTRMIAFLRPKPNSLTAKRCSVRYESTTPRGPVVGAKPVRGGANRASVADRGDEVGAAARSPAGERGTAVPLGP
jgi:hypothetical protein